MQTESRSKEVDKSSAGCRVLRVGNVEGKGKRPTRNDAHRLHDADGLDLGLKAVEFVAGGCIGSDGLPLETLRRNRPAWHLLKPADVNHAAARAAEPRRPPPGLGVGLHAANRLRHSHIWTAPTGSLYRAYRPAHPRTKARASLVISPWHLGRRPGHEFIVIARLYAAHTLGPLT
jgi:hypothetical protein